MARTRFVLLLLMSATGFPGCIWDGGDEMKLKAGYYLYSEGGREDTHLGVGIPGVGGVGVVDQTVFAVDTTGDFIIAKQHPRRQNPRKFPEHTNRSITNYYIIPLKFQVEKSLDDNVIGPLSQQEFNRKRIDLNIPNPDFEIVFHLRQGEGAGG